MDLKTYKTWEVIKMITENPKLKFKNYLGEEMVYALNYIRFFRNGENVSLYGIAGDEEWTLMQEPVDFMTAVKSGKRIKIEHELINHLDIFTEYNCLDDALNELVSYCNALDTKKVLTEGKFYIEEQEGENGN